MFNGQAKCFYRILPDCRREARSQLSLLSKDTASKLELYVYLDRALVKQARLHAELSKPLLDINTITKAA